MHIYAFGSICRGEIDKYSDVDIIAIVDSFDERLDPDKFSIYSYNRIKELWKEGNPFAWHLYIESKIIYSSNEKNFIAILGKPCEYQKGEKDCIKFYRLFESAVKAIKLETPSKTFELSNIFLSIRNFATCYQLANGIFCFSRDSALQMEEKVPIQSNSYSILEKARILCTRGLGKTITKVELDIVKKELNSIKIWMENTLEEL